MEEIITVNDQQYILNTPTTLTQAQRNEVINKISRELSNKISTLSVNKTVGQIVTLTATGSGGTSPYTATFRQTNGAGSIVSTGSLTATYTIPSGDAGKTVTFYAKVTDNCATPKQSPEVSDTTIVSVVCNPPTCGFTIV